MLGDIGLLEDHALGGVEAGGEPVEDHLAAVLLELRRVIVAGRQHVPVDDGEKAGVLGLQADPIVQRPPVISQVETAGGTHAGKDDIRALHSVVDSSVSRRVIPDIYCRPAGRRHPRPVLCF